MIWLIYNHLLLHLYPFISIGNVCAVYMTCVLWTVLKACLSVMMILLLVIDFLKLICFEIIKTFFFFFLAFDFCRFCAVIRFLIPATTANDLWLRKNFHTRSYQLHYFLILFLEKKPVFLFSMFSAKQVNYSYNLYNVFGISPSSRFLTV